MNGVNNNIRKRFVDEILAGEGNFGLLFWQEVIQRSERGKLSQGATLKLIPIRGSRDWTLACYVCLHLLSVHSLIHT